MTLIITGIGICIQEKPKHFSHYPANINSKTVNVSLLGQKYTYTSSTSSELVMFTLQVERKSSVLANVSGVAVHTSKTNYFSLDLTADWTVANTIQATGQNAVASAADINCYQLKISIEK